MNLMTRRAALRGLAGAGLFSSLGGFKAVGAAAEPGALLKMGVLSDIHLRDPGDEKTLLRALEYFRDHGAESVLVAGDFADTGRISQAKMLADAWYKVFPNDRLPDGRHVEKLFVYGNHCVTAWTWGNRYKDKPELAKAEAIGFENNRARIWDEFFHEEYKPIWMKTVKGIPVVGAHWGDVAIADFMKEHGKEIDPKLPFVYTQHAHPKDTCFGTWAWGHDDGRSTRALTPFPNAVAFSGHSHYTLTDERTVWQGAFTSINTASLKYASTDYALRENIGGNGSGFRGENRKHRMSQPNTCDGRQGMLVSYYADHLAIERREFVYGESLGPDWVVPMPAANETYSYAARAKKRTAPAFAADAAVAVKVTEPKDEKDFTHVELEFPAAQTVDGCRVYEYEVTAVLCEDEVELVQAQRRMMSPDYYRPAAKLVDKASFTFAAEDLTAKGRYRFEVRPVECFGKKGEAICSPLTAIRKA